MATLCTMDFCSVKVSLFTLFCGRERDLFDIKNILLFTPLKVLFVSVIFFFMVGMEFSCMIGFDPLTFAALQFSMLLKHLQLYRFLNKYFFSKGVVNAVYIFFFQNNRNVFPKLVIDYSDHYFFKRNITVFLNTLLYCSKGSNVFQKMSSCTWFIFKNRDKYPLFSKLKPSGID